MALDPGDPPGLGPYRLIARLGRGGMGTVFLGEQPSGRRVAIKVINRELAGEAAFRERFRREVTAAKQVRRFCTAPVLDAELDREPLYVVTEYIEGPSLERAVAERGPLPGSDLEGLAVGVATALAAIHGAGIVHRDLKPANVLLSATGPRVIDFGIARALDEAEGPTRTGQFIGTPGYLPPELLHGEPVTAASDIFSWGCVVAYAGTGRAPFSGRTVPEIFYRIAHDPPVLDGLDETLRGLVASALDKDPRNRPTTQHLLAELVGHERSDPERAAETVQATWHQAAAPHQWQPAPPSRTTRADPPPAHPPRAPHAGKSLLLRHPRLALALGTLIVVAVAVPAVWLVLSRTGAIGSPPPDLGRTLRERDNFENIGSGWPNGPVECGRYESGAYSMAVKGVNDNAMCAAPGQKQSTTARYLTDTKVTLRSGPSSGQWDAGVYLLKKDSHRYDVVIRPDGTARLRKVENDRGIDVMKATITDFTKFGATRIQVLLDLSTPSVRIALWANGEKAFEYDDKENTVHEGTSGLIVNRPYQGADADAVANFDDYTVTEATS